MRAQTRVLQIATATGISSGWADLYNGGVPCQYIGIDNVTNGDYTLQSTTNAKHVVSEDCFGDNTEWTGLRIAGNVVSEITPLWIPEDASRSTVQLWQ